MKPKHLKPEMVLAVLEDRKTQTRMPMTEKFLAKMRLAAEIGEISYFMDNGCLQPNDESYIVDFAKYKLGDVLYIRERARLTNFTLDCRYQFTYEADGKKSDFIEIPERIKEIGIGHCVPNGCFRELARIFLKVTGVRIDRIQDISDDDAMAEGITLEQAMSYCCSDGFRAHFSKLWDDCYGQGAWDFNDWCFVYDFERTDKP
jgi:hypothetical protein